MTRLLNFFEPDLAQEMRNIDHSLYLIKWFMTLFAHTLPLKKLTQIIWPDLFCERIDYLFFVALAILSHLKDRLLLQRKINYQISEDEEGLHELEIIQILSGSLASVFSTSEDVNNILETARGMQKGVPISFICYSLLD